MSASLVLICDADSDDVCGHLRGSADIGSSRRSSSKSLAVGSSWRSLDTDSVNFNSLVIHVLIQPGDELVLVVRVATDMNPVMQYD